MNVPLKALVLTLFGHTLEVATLISVLCIHFVWVDRSGDIVLFHHDPVEIDKRFGDHVKPFIRKSFGLFLESIPQESAPS